MKNSALPADLDIEIWKKPIDSMKKFYGEGKKLPDINIWGGEPLLYDKFNSLVHYIHDLGFKIGLVTNGTLIDRQVETINSCISTVYISIDGPKEIHEKVRGKGIFNKITKNIAFLDTHRIKTVCLCTINQDNYKIIPDFPFLLGKMNINKVIFQNLMFSTANDVKTYKNWLTQTFNIATTRVDSWVVNDFGDYINELPEMVRKLEDNIKTKVYPVEVVLYPFELSEDNIIMWFIAEQGLPMSPRKIMHCYAPFQHLHISSQGNVHYCVDFDDFSAGNIINEDIMDIFENQLSNLFRNEIAKGNNLMCKRCPWKYNTQYQLD